MKYITIAQALATADHARWYNPWRNALQLLAAEYRRLERVLASVKKIRGPLPNPYIAVRKQELEYVVKVLNNHRSLQSQRMPDAAAVRDQLLGWCISRLNTDVDREVEAKRSTYERATKPE